MVSVCFSLSFVDLPVWGMGFCRVFLGVFAAFRGSTGVDPECRYRYQSSFPQFWPFLALMVMVWVAWGLARFGGSSSGGGGKVEGKGTEGS